MRTRTICAKHYIIHVHVRQSGRTSAINYARSRVCAAYRQRCAEPRICRRAVCTFHAFFLRATSSNCVTYVCASSEVHASARSRRQAARDRALTEYVSDVRDVTATGAEHRALHTDAAMNYAVDGCECGCGWVMCGMARQQHGTTCPA